MKKSLIKNLNQLARIGLNKKEEKSLQKDLEQILEFVSKLPAENPSDIQAGPPACEACGGKNVMREDELPEDGKEHSTGEFIKVKKVLNDQD